MVWCGHRQFRLAAELMLVIHEGEEFQNFQKSNLVLRISLTRLRNFRAT